MSTTSTATLTSAAPAASATSRVPRLLRRLIAVFAVTVATVLGVGTVAANATGYSFGASGSVGYLISHGLTTCSNSLRTQVTTPEVTVSEVGSGWATRYQIVTATTTVQAWWSGAWHDYTKSTQTGSITGYAPGPSPYFVDQSTLRFDGQILQVPALRGYWIRIATTFTWYAASSGTGYMPYPSSVLGSRSYFYSADSYVGNLTTNLNPGGACVVGA
jgi:hypothetical protein